ncbi:hypothetical protein [Herbaspirillum sp. SJZ099]|uniref:hypothetical protein n=1 Tax=Herbaspirillum sp. SJZ099 TaxID=2572916 RepID=UPI0011A9B6ED|nr:hypothetical protein [Herbaspirillum sp. SJZ099]
MQSLNIRETLKNVEELRDCAWNRIGAPNRPTASMEPLTATAPPKGIMATFKSFNPSISQPQPQPQTGQPGQTGLTPSRILTQKQHQLRQAPGTLGNTEVVPMESVDSSAGWRNLSFSKKTLRHFVVPANPRQQQREQQSARRGSKDKSEKKEGEEEWSLLDSPVETVARHAPAMFNPTALLERQLGQSREKDRETREEVERRMAAQPSVLDAVGTMLRARIELEAKQQKPDLQAADRFKAGKVKNSVSQILSSLVRSRMGEIRSEFKKVMEVAETGDPSLEPPRALRREMRIIVGAPRDSEIETELSVAVMARALQRNAPDCFIEMADVICSQMVGSTLNQENLRKNPVRNRGAYALAISDSKCFMQLRSTWGVARRLLVNLSELKH